jgi:RNA polymerase sigma-70 factor (ECF subfamily)
MDDLIEKAKTGDAVALAELFGRHRKRLRAMVDLRLDRRLRGRVDPSDVLQEAFIDLAKRLPKYSTNETLPFYLWLRLVTGERLLDFHRKHLGAAKRDVRQEVTIHRRSIPNAESQSIAAGLLGRYTSGAGKAIRGEMQVKLQETLNNLDETAREIIVLRNFEEMTNVEAAMALGLSQNGASNRYMRALKRLRKALEEVPGFREHEPTHPPRP